MTATASSPDSTIKSVSFLQIISPTSYYIIDKDSTAPYSYKWTGITPQTITLQAQALAANNHFANSAPVTITVVQDVPPSVSITSPADGSTFASKSTIALAATATSTDTTITQVEFYNGSTLIKKVTASPYAYSWPKVATGTYTITAVATDALGVQTTSSPISVTVNP